MGVETNVEMVFWEKRSILAQEAEEEEETDEHRTHSGFPRILMSRKILEKMEIHDSPEINIWILVISTRSAGVRMLVILVHSPTTPISRPPQLFTAVTTVNLNL